MYAQCEAYKFITLLIKRTTNTAEKAEMIVYSENPEKTNWLYYCQPHERRKVPSSSSQPASINQQLNCTVPPAVSLSVMHGEAKPLPCLLQVLRHLIKLYSPQLFSLLTCRSERPLIHESIGEKKEKKIASLWLATIIRKKKGKKTLQEKKEKPLEKKTLASCLQEEKKEKRK